MTVREPTGCRRWMVLKRAREPYDAVNSNQHPNRPLQCFRNVHTECVCGHHDTVLVVESKYTGTGHNRLPVFKTM